jgi:Predicted transcriptional regulators
LDLLTLKSLVAGELHGLEVLRRIQQITGGTFAVEPGSLFPALHRMEEEGFGQTPKTIAARNTTS